MSNSNNAAKYIYFESKLAPGKVIDISQNPKNLGNAILYDYHKAQNQHFALLPSPQKGLFFIQSQLSKKVLTVNGHNDSNGALMVQQANNGLPSQKFKIEQVSENSQEYYIFTFCGKAVDICGASHKNEAPLIQWQLNGQANQVWKIRYVDF